MKALILIVFLSFVSLQKLYAYLDPGTGSYIFQILIGVLVAGLYAVKLFWSRIKLFFSKIFNRNSQTNDNK